jgi:cyclophilin family peptidyl-prolyl cis-trans isomerase
MPSTHRSKRIVSVILSSAALLALIGGYFKIMLKEGPDAAKRAAEVDRQSRLSAELEAGLVVDKGGLSRAVATLQTTRGRIRFRFYAEDAPKTTRRVAQLIRSGFYSGLVFHRVDPGFVVQGGDPTGTGEGGSGETIPAEFNQRKHVPGTLAMARTEDPDSADSQFYISLGTHPRLDGRYTVFGQITEGLEVLHQIRAGDRMTSITIDF